MCLTSSCLPYQHHAPLPRCTWCGKRASPGSDRLFVSYYKSTYYGKRNSWHRICSLLRQEVGKPPTITKELSDSDPTQPPVPERTCRCEGHHKQNLQSLRQNSHAGKQPSRRGCG